MIGKPSNLIGAGTLKLVLSDLPALKLPAGHAHRWRATVYLKGSVVLLEVTARTRKDVMAVAVNLLGDVRSGIEDLINKIGEEFRKELP